MDGNKKWKLKLCYCNIRIERYVNAGNCHRDRVIDRVLQAIQAGSKGRAMK